MSNSKKNKDVKSNFLLNWAKQNLDVTRNKKKTKVIKEIRGK